MLFNYHSLYFVETSSHDLLDKARESFNWYVRRPAFNFALEASELLVSRRWIIRMKIFGAGGGRGDSRIRRRAARNKAHQLSYPSMMHFARRRISSTQTFRVAGIRILSTQTFGALQDKSIKILKKNQET